MSVQRLRLLEGASAVGTAVAAAACFWAAVAEDQFELAIVILVMILGRTQSLSERAQRVGSLGLVLAIAATAGAIGDPSVPLLVAVLIVVAEFGFTARPRAAIAMGLAAAIAVVVAGMVIASEQLVAGAGLWPLALIPFVALASSQLRSMGAAQATAELESVTIALDEIVRMAERMPAGFDWWSVATAVDDELREASGAGPETEPHSHLFVVRDGVLFGVGVPWGRRAVALAADLPRGHRRRTWSPVASEQLPVQMQAQLGAGPWYLARLGPGGVRGAVLVRADIRSEVLDELTDVLGLAAVTMLNVDRFERLEELATSSARIRLGHDLHDGIAQALTHVRIELDLLGLQHPDVVSHAGRIRAVVDAALLDVRCTVDSLREIAPLRERIERHVQLLSSLSPAAIELEVSPVLDVPEGVSDQVFRIVQEALSNAVRHAEADSIHVSVLQDATSLTVAVVDDGRGIAVGAAAGVGLAGMRSRTHRLGGRIVVRERRGGGTVVEVNTPIRLDARLPKAVR
ncbi:MAG: signal transduction histidine kinase [Nonlabens sp.]|jgi:signal transduction histidine kinase